MGWTVKLYPANGNLLPVVFDKVMAYEIIVIPRKDEDTHLTKNI